MDVDHARFLARLKKLQGETKDAAFARAIGVPASTLKQYEKGSFPSIAIAAKIAAAFNVTVDWLSGIDDRPRAWAAGAPLSDRILEELGKIVVREHKAAGQRLPPEMIAPEAGALYNELLGRVRDPSDIEAMEAMLPILERNLRERLQKSVAAPGTGKREAS